MEELQSGNEIQLDVEQVSRELRIRPEIYVKIVVSFANSLAGKLKALSEALAIKNNDQVRMILHEIKGTAGNLRLKNIAEAENIMHVAVKAGENSKQLSQYYENLRLESEKLQRYITRFSNPSL